VINESNYMTDVSALILEPYLDIISGEALVSVTKGILDSDLNVWGIAAVDTSTRLLSDQFGLKILDRGFVAVTS
jgi:hypothetical protein